MVFGKIVAWSGVFHYTLQLVTINRLGVENGHPISAFTSRWSTNI